MRRKDETPDPNNITWVNITALCEIFGVTRMTIYRWRNRGAFEAAQDTTFGSAENQVRFDLSKVVAEAEAAETPMPGLVDWKNSHLQEPA